MMTAAARPVRLRRHGDWPRHQERQGLPLSILWRICGSIQSIGPAIWSGLGRQSTHYHPSAGKTPTPTTGLPIKGGRGRAQGWDKQQFTVRDAQ